MSKKNMIHEGLSKFIGDFFDGVKTNTTKRYLDKAKKAGLPKPMIDRMAKIEKERQELDKLIQKYSK
jgi:transposase